MSEQASATLPTGAYVIRNSATTTVLHTRYPDAPAGTSVHVYQRDEGTFKDQQIWWIEPLANRNSESALESVYSITSPGSGNALEANPDAGWVYTKPYCGEPWQLWKLQKSTGGLRSDGSYNIVNTFTNRVLDLNGVKPSPNAWVNIQRNSPSRSYNRWEFEIPVVGFPPGWFEIENVGSSDMLSHEYGHSAPVLLAPSMTQVQPQYRCQWQFQWTLSHSKCYHSGATEEPNSWYIINRLTRAPLSPHCGTMAVKDFANRDNVLAWKLELDGNCNWKIINRSTFCLLRQMTTLRGGGTDVDCSERRFELSGGRQSWILREQGATAAPEFVAASIYGMSVAMCISHRIVSWLYHRPRPGKR